MIQFKIKLVTALFLILSFNITAQEKISTSEREVNNLIQESEKLYSVNDEIINGCVQSITFSKPDYLSYQDDFEWSDGILFINGKAYSNLHLKYNLALDDIMLKVYNQDGGNTIFSLNKSQVDSFIIVNSLYINTHKSISDKKKQNYYEQLFSGKTFSLKKQNIQKYSKN